MKPTPHVTIITLNWNAWQDTVECLESVLKSDYPNFNVFVIDNHSVNDSVQQIINWAEGKSDVAITINFPENIYPLCPKPLDFATLSINRGNCNLDQIKNKHPRVSLFLNDTNAGFARANNLGMVYALTAFGSDYIFLLNNDTVITPQTLNNLVQAMEQNTEIGAAQAVIYQYHRPVMIANAGGMILPWGQTKYYKHIQPNQLKRITFINGCALFLRSETILKYGLLTEDFFHGEEDFEYSMRLNRLGVKMVCVGGTAVFHKIGITAHAFMQRQTANKVLLFAINRLVDMKKFYRKPLWLIWRELALLYFSLLLILQYRESLRIARTVMKKVRVLSQSLDKVDKPVVDAILKG